MTNILVARLQTTIASYERARMGMGDLVGQVFAIFVIMLAAAEAVIGLAIVLAIYQNLRTIDVGAAETLRG